MEPRKLPLPKEEKKAAGEKKAKRYIRVFGLAAVFIFICTQLGGSAHADTLGISIDTAGDGSDMDSLKLLFTFALIALAPSLLIMMTSFTRIIIVFSFLRNALGLQQTPPNQVLVGLALFLSYFIMHPVITTMNETALKPYSEGLITQEEALQTVQIPLKQFMLKQTKIADLNLFLSLSEQAETVEEINPDSLLELGLETIVPSFITSELKRAFMIGFLLFLPFLVIDMIVASTLMSMGMVMLPPSMISLPFKIMLFVVVDGWSLIMEMLIRSFY